MNPRYFLSAIILAAYTLVLSPAEARHRTYIPQITCNQQGCSDRPSYNQQSYGYKASETPTHARSVAIHGNMR